MHAVHARALHAHAGEVDLGGGLRPVSRLDQRLVEVAKLGCTRCIVPKVLVRMHGCALGWGSSSKRVGVSSSIK